MDEQASVLRERFAKLLREMAEVKVALDRAEGKIQGVPHYSVIEETAHQLGREVSRRVQEMHVRELVADQPLSGKCPQCGIRSALRPQQRTVRSGDGPVELTELAGYCPCCRRAFFPAPRTAGI